MKVVNFLIGVPILFFATFISADISITTGGSKINLYNNSNVPVTVSITYAAPNSSRNATSASIEAGATGAILYVGGTPSAPIIMTSIKINYATSSPDPVALTFSPTALGKNLYIYGDGTVPLTSFAGPKDSAGNIIPATAFPSRYVAWWTGDIDTTANDTAAAAIADTTTNSKVTLYMMSVDGKNSLLTF